MTLAARLQWLNVGPLPAAETFRSDPTVDNQNTQPIEQPIIDAEFTVEQISAAPMDPAAQPGLPAVQEFNRNLPRPTLSFDYGFTRIEDIEVETKEDPKSGAKRVVAVILNGERHEPTNRFWYSLMSIFGFSGNIFNYFTHQEVFNRISTVHTSDRLRFTVQRETNHAPKLLATSRPERPIIQYDELLGLMQEHGGQTISYANGLLNSTHIPRIGADQWLIGPDAMMNRYLLEAPIDGYGKPCCYLGCERLVCSNGAVARVRAFRTELNVGKGDDVVQAAVIRALDSFNDEDGWAALRNRLTVSGQSWASIQESSSLYKTLVSLYARKQLLGVSQDEQGHYGEGSRLLQRLHDITGDVAGNYGIANVDTLSDKRKRVLPVQCTVFDLINLATEVATHHAVEGGRQTLHSWVGQLVGDAGGYDLENTKQKWTDYRDFWVSSKDELQKAAMKKLDK